MERLFARGDTLHLTSLADAVLAAAAIEAHTHLTLQLQQEGFLPPTKQQDRTIRKVARFIFAMGGLVAGTMVYAVIFEWDVVTAVLYPRFPVDVSELVLWLWPHSAACLLS